VQFYCKISRTFDHFFSAKLYFSNETAKCLSIFLSVFFVIIDPLK